MPEITPRDMSGGTSAVSAAPIPQENRQLDTTVSAPALAQEEKAKQEAHDPRLAALARHQKAVREEQRALQAEKLRFEAERAAHSGERKAVEEANAWKQRLQQDPYGVMLESGLTADQVASLMLNQPNPADQRVILLEQKIAQLEAQQGKTLSKFDEVQKQQYEDAKKQIHNDVVATVNSDQSFETIKAMNAQQAVVDLIEATFQKDGQLMSIEDAAKEVEDYLIEEAMKFTALNKIKKRLYPEQPPAQVQQEAPQKQAITPRQMPTLTNRLAQSAASRPLTDRERKERAIAAFNGTLK